MIQNHFMIIATMLFTHLFIFYIFAYDVLSVPRIRLVLTILSIRRTMNLKRAILLTATALGLASAALADGFSATLDVPIIPTNNFSVRLGLNYSLEVSPNLFIGASLNPSITPGAADVFGLSARVGAKYVLLLLKNSTTSVNAYVGAGLDATIIPAPFSIGVDVNAGIYAVTAIGGGFKLYGGADGEIGYIFTGAGAFVYSVIANVGVFFEPVTNLEFRVQGTAALIGVAGLTGFGWGIGSSLYYTIVPQFKVGLTVSYGSGGAFVFGLGALFAEKPGTLGIAGNYLP